MAAWIARKMMNDEIQRIAAGRQPTFGVSLTDESSTDGTHN